MFKLELILVILKIVFHSTDGGLAVGLADIHPDHPDKCHDQESGALVSEGSFVPMANACGVMHCIGDTKKLYVSYKTCSSVSTDPWCELESDLSMPYPDCCPRPKCPEFLAVPEENDVSQLRDDAANVSDSYDDVTLEDLEGNDADSLEKPRGSRTIDSIGGLDTHQKKVVVETQ